MKNKITTFNPIRLLKKALVVTLATCSLSLASFANAALIGVELNGAPDINTIFNNSVYDQGAGVLSITGFTSTIILVDGSPSTSLPFEIFDLTANIDNSGLFSGGNFTAGTALTGDITTVGFNTAGQLDFLFTVTGGTYAPNYGLEGGIIVANSGINGDLFSVDFSNATANVDIGTVKVPEPTALLLMGMGLIGFTLKRRSF